MAIAANIPMIAIAIIGATTQIRLFIRNPFETINKHLPAKQRTRNDKVFGFQEWMQFLVCVPAIYRPHLELLVMTGLSASEMAGLRKEDVSERYITLQRSIVLGVEKEKLKNDYRFRRIPMEDDVEEILRYFGRDYLVKPDKKKSPLLVFGDSYGDSQNPIHIT